jgi:hypothetical protein
VAEVERTFSATKGITSSKKNTGRGSAESTTSHPPPRGKNI